MNTSPECATSRSVLNDVVAALASGRPIVLDSADRGSHLVLAADRARGDTLGWTVRHTSGFVLAAMTGQRLDALQIPPMIGRHDSSQGAFAVSVDANANITTGISGYDRATTLRTLASPHTQPGDLVRPGHVVPVRTQAGGVLARSDAPEAAVDLMRCAGLPPVAAAGALIDHRGELLEHGRTRRFAAEHALARCSVADLVTHRLRTEPVTVRHPVAPVHTPHGVFAVYRYRDTRTGSDYLAFCREHASHTGPSPRLSQHACLGWPGGHDLERALAHTGPRSVLLYLPDQGLPAGAEIGRVANEVLYDLGAEDVHLCRCAHPGADHDPGTGRPPPTTPTPDTRGRSPHVLDSSAVRQPVGDVAHHGSP